MNRLIRKFPVRAAAAQFHRLPVSSSHSFPVSFLISSRFSRFSPSATPPPPSEPPKAAKEENEKTSENTENQPEQVKEEKSEKSSSSDTSGRSSTPVSWRGFSLIVGLGASLVIYYKFLSDRRTRKTMQSEVTVTGRAAIGGPFSLIDDAGKTVTSNSLSGCYPLIYFGFSKCPDICPTELKKLENALEMLRQNSKTVSPLIESGKLFPVFISIDPRRDTPERLSKYKTEFPALTNNFAMKWLTGPDSAIREVAKAYRVYYSAPDVAEGSDEEYLVDHSIFFYLVDRQGEVLDYMGKNLTAKEMAEKIEKSIQNDLRGI